MEIVKIGCKLPHGLTLEIGYQTHIKVDNRLVPQYKQLENYQAVTLKGSNSLIVAGAAALLNPDPGITEVPKDFWDAWLASTQGKQNIARKNGLIFVVPDDAASAKAQSIDVKALRSGLEPMDPSQLPEEVTEKPVDGRPPLTAKARAA